MKITMAILVLLTSNYAFAELKWVQGPFWKTIYENRFLIPATTSNKEIKSECQYFRNLAQDSQGNSNNISNVDFKMIDTMALPSDMENPNFQLDLTIGIPNNLTVADHLEKQNEIIELVNSTSVFDALPNYTQMPSEIRLTEPSLSRQIQLVKTSNSLTALADQLRVDLSQPKLLRTGSLVTLRTNSKAIACDLLSGQIKVVLPAQAQVKILLESQIKLQSDYSELEIMAVDLIAKSKNPRVRAALFGFRIGEILDKQYSNSSVQSEKRMLALLDQLFDTETMSPSPVWQEGLHDKTISVPGTSSPVDVTVELTGKE